VLADAVLAAYLDPVRPDSTSFRMLMIWLSVNLLFLMMSSFLDPEDSPLQWLKFRRLDQDQAQTRFATRGWVFRTCLFL
jgi:hypothetical protein